MHAAAVMTLVLCGLTVQSACARASSEAVPAEASARGSASGPAVASGYVQRTHVVKRDDRGGERDFNAFWRDFRAAVIRRDHGSIAAMTHFPFKTRGETDESPEKECDRAGFERILGSLLSEDVGLSREPESMSDYIGRLDHLPTGTVEGDAARVGQFEFRRVAGRWLWVKAYVSE